MKFFIFILFCISSASCHFKTRFSLTASKISFNHTIENGLTVQLLQVDSFGADAFPARFKPESTYTATRLRYLPDDEAAELLPQSIKTEFLRYAATKDSIIKHKINDTLLTADTIYWEDGSRMYRSPGIHRSVEWDKAFHKTEDMAYRNISNKKIRTYLFGSHGKGFCWRAGAGDWMESKKTVAGFRLIPGRWYTIRFKCNYGLLADGYCTLFFSTDEKGRITVKKVDDINDGPF